MKASVSNDEDRCCEILWLVAEDFQKQSKMCYELKMHIISAIIEQHAEEVAFNWLLRDSAVTESGYNLVDLAQLDERVEANIDGLRLAGDKGWEICKEAMAIGEPGEIFAAGVLSFESQVPERMDTVLAAVVQNADLQRALCSALGWIEFRKIADPARKLLGADLVFLRRTGLSAHAVQRQDPGLQLGTLITDDDPRLRSRALKAAGELGRLDLLPLVLEHINDDDEKCSFYAAWSVTLLGQTAGIETLKALVTDLSPYGQRACELAVRKMPIGDAVNWLAELTQHSTCLRSAVFGYGALGDPSAVDWLIEMMSVPETARAAGQGLSMITGVDVAYQDLEGEAPEGFEAGPTESPEDEDVALDPDEDLPWPEPDRIRKWWTENGKGLTAGGRYLAGRQVSADHCRRVLAGGFQRQRISAALELALIEPGRPLFETRAPGFRQQGWAGTKK